MLSIFALVLLATVASSQASTRNACTGTQITTQADVQTWLSEVNATLTNLLNEVTAAEWNWATDITDAHADAKAEKNAQLAEQFKTLWAESACINCTAASCTDTQKRRVEMYASIGTSSLPAQKFDDYGVIQVAMDNIYSVGKVCRPDGTGCKQLDPGLTELLLTSDDYCDQQWAWEGWRNETGRKMRGYYTSYVLLQNEAAILNKFKSAKEMWTHSYVKDEPNFFAQIELAWQDILPFYKELHGYALGKLKEKYGSSHFPSSGHIPAHLLGNMWAQDWDKLYSLMVPYPDAEQIDLTQLLEDEGWSEMKLFTEADDFFQSIGLGPMTQDFWGNSVFLRKPEPIEMVCHASAWDFLQQTDFRIKMCTVVTAGDFQTVHHEMGHIQYYMQYKDKPIEFREGANSGFHEAIGDLIALSVMTPLHYKTIGLLPNTFKIDSKTTMNSLMSMALQKVPFMPFGYLMDKYRWDLFERNTSFAQMNKAWWDLRCEMQGISSPVPRSEQDFDAGAKYHVPASVPYIRYFFAHVAQFQFHTSICAKMNITENIAETCDIYNHPDIAMTLRDAMALGSSSPYPDVLETLTGSRTLDATAMIDYFRPLYEWLKEQNTKLGYSTEWEAACPVVKRNTCDYNVATDVASWLGANVFVTLAFAIASALVNIV